MSKKKFTGAELMFEKHLHMTVRIVLTNIACLFVLGGGGYLLDTAMKTRPLFLILGTIGAFIAAQIIIVILISKLTK